MLVSLFACTQQPADKAKSFKELSAEPMERAYVDEVLNDLGHSDSFISLNVSNHGNIKRLIVENGRFFSIYSNDEQSFHKDAYIATVKPYVLSGKALELTDAHWRQLSQNMLDTNDHLTEKQYRAYKGTYFRNNLQSKPIEYSMLLKLADYAFINGFFINKNDISGYYLIDSVNYLK